MGLPYSMLLANPVILSYSLKRIGSRLEFVRLKAPFIMKQYTLSYWIQPNDKIFIEVRLCCGSIQEYNIFKNKLPLIWHWEHTRNASFLTDTTLATDDPTATPYALVAGLAEWWVCHFTKSTMPSGYRYDDLDDCAYEDSDYYNRPSRHPP